MYDLYELFICTWSIFINKNSHNKILILCIIEMLNKFGIILT